MLRPQTTNESRQNLDFFEDPFDFMNHMFDNFWGNDLESVSNMRTDVVEEDNDYKMMADLPGFDKKDISIGLKDGILTVSAAHSSNTEDKGDDGKFIRRERRATSYQRSFNVGEDIKPEDVSATYENGVLTLTLPKKQLEAKEDEVKQIEVH